jgi:hypothetical protein
MPDRSRWNPRATFHRNFTRPVCASIYSRRRNKVPPRQGVIGREILIARSRLRWFGQEHRGPTLIPLASNCAISEKKCLEFVPLVRSTL